VIIVISNLSYFFISSIRYGYPNKIKGKQKMNWFCENSFGQTRNSTTRKGKAGAFFAVEAEELHPESVVPNFLPDVEHRCEVGLPKVTIKVEGSRTTSKLFPTSINTLQEYRNEQTTVENRKTIVKGCKEHLKHRFCKYSHRNKTVFTIKASEYKNHILTLNVLQGNHLGIPYRGTSEHLNKHHIKVSCWTPNGMRCESEDSLIRLRNNIIDLVDHSVI
jgi:hypothetical protein